MLTLALSALLASAPAHEPTMKITVARLEASSAKKAISAVLHDQLEALKGCYDLALKDSPGLTGKVGVKFDIPKGTALAGDPVATEGGLTDPTLVPCVLARLRSAQWPKVQTTTHVELALQFSLKP